jgi:cytochrome b
MSDLGTLPWARQTKPVAATAPSRRVTDATTRVTHGLMAVTFLLAYLSADSEYWRLLHVTMGYSLAGLLVFRLAFGVIGPRYARLSVLWRRVALAWGWLRTATNWREWSQQTWQQSMMMGINASIALAMVAVVVLTATGYMVFQDWGPEWWLDVSEGLHELASNLMWAAVALHVGSVLAQSWLKSPGFWQRMWSGRIPGKGPDLARSNLVPVAVVVVAAVLGFWLAVWSGWLSL